jgi:hypothetical protein
MSKQVSLMYQRINKGMGGRMRKVHFSVVLSDDVKGSIVDFILNKDIDVLTMLTYKVCFEGLVLVSQKLATNLDIPILAIPIQ